jgi:hypothetical protein
MQMDGDYTMVDKMSIRTKDGLLYEMFDKVHVYFPTNAFKQSNQNDEIA